MSLNVGKTIFHVVYICFYFFVMVNVPYVKSLCILILSIEYIHKIKGSIKGRWFLKSFGHP